MPVTKNIMVRAVADFSGISKQAAKAKASMVGMRSGVTSACNGMSAAVGKMNKIMSSLGVTLSAVGILYFAKSAKEAYEVQAEGETKLATIMRQRMAASDGEIKSVVDLIAAQQELGVVADEVQLAGAQQLSTFINQKSSLDTLVPAMNDLIAQQKGLNSTTGDAVNIGNLMGKAMQGQVTSLKRVGITFSDAEAAAIKYGNEEQRAAMLSQIITNNVGRMNTALAATPSGRLTQVSNRLSDIKESAGGAITSILTVFLPALNAVCRVLASMATLANRVAQALANVFGGGAKSSAAVVSYGGSAVGTVDDLTDSTNGAAAASKKLSSFGFDTLQKLSDTSSSGSGGGSSADTSGASGGISETGGAAEDAGESVGWLERALLRLKKTYESLNFDNLTAALGRLKEAFAPFGEAIGAGLRWVYDNVLEPLAQWTVSDLLPAFLDVLSGCFTVLSEVIDALKPGAQWLWDNFLQPIAQWTGGAIVSVLEALAGALTDIGNWIKDHKDLVLAIASGLAAFALGWTLVLAALSGATTIQGVIAAFAGLGTVIGVVKYAFALLTSPVGLVIAGIAALIAVIVLCVQHWQEIKDFAVGCWNSIKDAWDAAGEYFAGVFGRIKEAGSVIWDTIKGNAVAAWTGIKDAWSAVTGFFTDIWNGIKTGAETGWNNVKTAWGKVGSWWKTNVTDPISNGFKGCINGVIGFFEGLANKGVDAINVLVDALNSLSFAVPDWVPGIGGSTIGFNLPHKNHISLPRLASGAVFPGGKPYAAIVNDQPSGQTNIESPLGTIVDAMLIALNNKDMGGVDVNVTANFQGQLAPLARILNPYIEAEARRRGTPAVAAG